MFIHFTVHTEIFVMDNLCLLLLLFFFSSSVVVAAISSSSSSSKVRTLPGFQGPLPFQLETGYVGVDDLQLFYYFIESERNPKEDPLILWLTGGPGCSALSGLVYEIGPLNFNIVEYNGSLPTFALNAYSWTKVSSIIFVDAPVGTGFSYSRSSKEWKTSTTKQVNQTYSFLIKWLSDHPEFHKNPLYVAGDSYSGIIVPLIVQEIANGIEARKKPLINLKIYDQGYIEGNPSTESNYDFNARIPFAHRMALISDELYRLTKRSCEGNYVTVDSRNIECTNNLQAVSECTERINYPHILEQNCDLTLPKPNRIKEVRRSLEDNFENMILENQLPEFGCRTYNYLSSYYWANDEIVRNALNVRKGTIGTWERCNSLDNIFDIESTSMNHLNLNTKGYRALIYSGDHDMVVPYLGTLAWITSLNFSITDDWRPWFVDSQVAGYTRTFSKLLTFATVKGAGHTAPEYKPKECLSMLDRWLSHSPL